MVGEYDGLPDSWYIFGAPYWGQPGDRPNVPNVMVIITGNDTSNVSPVSSAAAAQGITVIAVGFEDISPTQLAAISGSPNRAYSTTPGNLTNVLLNICSNLGRSYKKLERG